MKKLLIFLVMNFLIRTLTLAETSVQVANNARVEISCKAMDFTCAGAGYLSVSNVGAGNPGIVYGSTTWLITNWGTNDGTFNFTTPTGGLGTVSSYPMSGSPSDIIIEAQTGFSDGWSHSHITNISTNKWKLDTPQCSASGSLTYHFILTAQPFAVAGTYVIIFIQSFVAD